MLWLAGLFFLALRKLSEKFIGGKTGRFTWFLPFLFLVLAVTALAYAPLPFGWGSIGGLLAGLLSWVFGWIGTLIGVSATAIAGILLVLVLAFGLVDLIKDRKPDGFAKTMVFAAPVLVLLASGPLAGNVAGFIDSLSSFGPNVVANITSS